MFTKRFSVICLLLVVALSCTTAKLEEKPKTPDFALIVRGNNEFVFALYGKLRTGKEGNLFLSPYSISTALAMTYAGAEGKTATEMAEVLHFTLLQERLHPAFAALAAKLHGDTKERGYQLRIANRLWGQAGYAFLPKFLQTTRDDYGAELAQVDFAHTEDARQTINTWVQDKTEKKIRDLIAPGVLNPVTRLVLTNAIYFKGSWSNPFDSKATHDAPFRITTAKQVRVPMMYQTGSFRFGKGDGVQILELPYVGKDLSMVVVLPDDVDGLANLEKKLTVEKLRDWTSGLQERMVHVDFPKFKMTSEFRLEQVLRSMGMPLAFDRTEADFSGMTGKRELFLSAVVHKAFIDVNEEGTEAAVTTEPVESLDGFPDFRADHPFLFLIRDNRTGSILFLGRVMNPEGYPKRLTAEQEKAVDEAQKLGGGVRMDKEHPGELGVIFTSRFTDADLEHLQGLTQFQALHVFSSSVTDAGLKHLKGLTQLRRLGLSGVKVTDAGLENLKGLTQLQELSLSSTNVTDGGLKHLKGLTQLQTLDLSSTSVSDAGLEHFKGLTKLRRLNLSYTHVTELEHLKGLTQLQELDLCYTDFTDAGLEHLKGLTQLQVLALHHTNVTDDGLKYLKGLAQLRELYLFDDEIFDAGLEHLKGLPKLQWLELSGTKVTDAGLKHLNGLTELRRLDLLGTKVSDVGVKDLRKALPNCKILAVTSSPP